MKPGIILQARLTSRRFPNKVMSPLLDKTVISWCIDACKKTKLPFVVAIPMTQTNNGLAAYLELAHPGIKIFRGHEEDLTLRYFDAAKEVGFDPIIRLCGDSPFVDPQDIVNVLELYKERGFLQRINYVQCFGFDELEYAKDNNVHMDSREHVAIYMDHTVEYPEDIKRLTDDWTYGESPTMIARKKFWNIHKED